MGFLHVLFDTGARVRKAKSLSAKGGRECSVQHRLTCHCDCVGLLRLPSYPDNTELGADVDGVLLPSMTLHRLKTDGDLLPDGI